jgi:hypothetical protein
MKNWRNKDMQFTEKLMQFSTEALTQVLDECAKALFYAYQTTEDIGLWHLSTEAEAARDFLRYTNQLKKLS